MSDVIDAFDPNIGRIQADAANSAPAFEYKPGLFENAAGSAAAGVGYAFTKVAQTYTTTVNFFDELQNERLKQKRLAQQSSPAPLFSFDSGINILSLDERIAAGEKRIEENKHVDQLLTEQTKSLRPDPRTTGAAGQILFGLADILPRAIVGTALGGPLGGAAAVGLPEGVSSYKVGVSDGLDKNTAAFKGLIEGTTAGAGVLLPGSGLTKGLVSDVALTIGANVGLGVVQRGAVNKLLSDRGYSEMAKQYDAWDKTALITDAILGAAFWGLSRGGEVRSEFSKKPEQPLVDAALTAENARHIQVESAIGVPADPRSLEIHSRQIESAIESLSRGEPVRVDPRLADAEFIRAKNIPESEVVKQMRIDYPELKAMDSNQHGIDGVPYRAVDGIADSVPYEAATVPAGGIDQAAMPAPADGTASQAAPANLMAGNTKVEAARQALNKYPDMQIQVDDGNGNVIKVSAAEHLRQLSEGDMATAQKESSAFEAAVNCFLGSSL
jgi:hypothetical protein